jgi:hypothetical protein
MARIGVWEGPDLPVTAASLGILATWFLKCITILGSTRSALHTGWWQMTRCSAQGTRSLLVWELLVSNTNDTLGLLTDDGKFGSGAGDALLI